jgi:hypothetical protein
VKFGAQLHVKGILGGTEEAGRHIGYLTKYLTKMSTRLLDSTNTPLMLSVITSGGCTLNYR